MKAPIKGNHPLPVLLRDGGDYNEKCEFNISIVGEPYKSGEGIALSYEYEVRVDVVCPPLEKLIENEEAKIVIIEEQDTIRQAIDYVKGCKILIQPYMLRLGKNIELTPIIIANKKTNLLFDKTYMDPIYGMFDRDSFEIEKGQILGYGRVLEIKTDQLRGLSSIIKIRSLEHEDLHKPFYLDLEQDIIYVYANKTIANDVKSIQQTQPSLSHMVNAVICYPTVHMAIEAMLTNHQEYEAYKWYAAIKNKLNEIRERLKESPFEPESFEPSKDNTISDYAWELTGELLTDAQGQMMMTAFEKASEYGE